ncbi:hypothetical protein K505DRAFT_328193 [Melanomma pulvis-pyrius CBS 109.77]|uniref:PHD-type domain-containing protein n=1 Tax=Melanomma pulvis-pyrius CBS 109.77 TaxID=1314802 RepID=A0A6A6WZ60_9PLEO|nr:hypothetical protein K505DRAFT_328193 [Melanomma pulvis-pyrius CBS 109.77]
MNRINPPGSNPQAANRPPPRMNAPPNLSAPHAGPKPSTAPAPPGRSSLAMPMPPQDSAPNFPQFSQSTIAILSKLQANKGDVAGSLAFEAKKAEVMQSYVTSDKLPTPPPIANTGKRGRGGGRFVLKTDVAGTSPAPGATPTSARGSGRGRNRGRGRGGGGRGGKRKRADSVDSNEDADSDISSSYTPLPTKTKSGRNVNRPVAFVPTIPEPTSGVKRRRSTKTILAAQCKICHRGTDPGNNRIVFCDICSTAYHQYCHDPAIDNDVVTVLEKEWLCGPCERSKQTVVEGTEHLIAGEGLSIDEKQAYLSTLPQARLVSLLLHSTIRHPELPIFPPDVRDLIPDTSRTSTTTQPTASKPAPAPQPPTPQPPSAHQVASPSNGLGSTGGTPHSQHIATDSSDMDPAEAQLFAEMGSSYLTSYHHRRVHSPPKQQQPPPQPKSQLEKASASTTANTNAVTTAPLDEYDDGYDTDPPAHYPKAGHGLARTLRPESEDLQWLVDDNFGVFSHGWKGDGSGVGADATLNGYDGAATEAMEGVVHGGSRSGQ